MAKESMKAREVKRAKMVAKYAEKRAALKKIINTTDDPAQAYESYRKYRITHLQYACIIVAR